MGISSSLFNLRHALQLGYQEPAPPTEKESSSIQIPTKSWGEDQENSSPIEGMNNDDNSFTIQDPATVWTISDDEDEKK